MKTTLSKSLTGLLILPFLASCQGQNSDPLSKYPGLKASPVGQDKSESQTAAPAVFSIDMEGTNQVNNGNFIEGEAGQVLIRVIPRSSKITAYDLKLTGFAIADRPELIKTDRENIFALQWTPRVGTIPGGAVSKSLQATFQAVVIGSPDPRLNGMSKTETLTINVNRNNSQPRIIGKTDLSKGLDENAAPQSFTVDIDDPGTGSGPGRPSLSISPYVYANTEAYRADGSPYFQLDPNRKPELLAGSNTKWRFYYTVQVTNLPLDRDRTGREIPSASSVDVCFQIRAFSVLKTWSDEEQICFKARYAAQPAVISFIGDEKVEAKAKVESLLRFRLASGHALSVVSLKNQSAVIAGLTGTKEIKCEDEVPGKKNSVICTIKWTPACTNAAISKTITMTASSVLGNKEKTSSYQKAFTVNPNVEACTPPAPQPKVAPAAAKPTAPIAAAKPTVTKPASPATPSVPSIPSTPSNPSTPQRKGGK